MNIYFENKIILEEISIADSFWKKLSGYMFRSKPHVSGILFDSSGSMQTTFMSFPLDIIFLDGENKVLKILRDVKPWRMTRIYKGTKKILEVPSNILPSEIDEGSQLIFQ